MKFQLYFVGLLTAAMFIRPAYSQSPESPDQGISPLQSENAFCDAVLAASGAWQPEYLYFFEWNPQSGSWDSLYYVEFTYNAQALLETATVFQHNNGFQLSQRSVYTYNAAQEVTEWLVRNWNGSGWSDDWKQISQFDGQGNRVFIAELQFNSTAWDTTVALRHHYVYDAQNLITQEVLRYRDNQTGSYLNLIRNTYMYDSNMDRSVWQRDYWVNNAWAASDRLRYYWQAPGSGLPDSTINAIWNGQSWETAGRTTISYGPYQSRDWFSDDRIGSNWVPNAWRTERNDSLLNPVLETIRERVSGTWTVTSRDDYINTYDGQGNLIEIIRRTGDSLTMENFWRYVYGYMKTVRNDPLRPEPVPSALPNPTTGVIVVRYDGARDQPADFTVFDMQGREIVAERIPQWSGTHAVRLGREWPNGVYFYRLRLGEHAFSGKVLLHR